MEETLREAPPHDDWRGVLAQTIDQERQRVGQRVGQQRERLRELEARLSTQLAEATQALARQQDEARQSATLSQAQESTAQDRSAEIERRAEELDHRAAELENTRQESDRRWQQLLSEIGSKLSQLDQQQVVLTQEAQQLSTRQATIRCREAELEQLRAGLEGQSAVHQERTDDLERRVAELDSARLTHAAELQKHQHAVEDLRRKESHLAIQTQSLAQQQHETHKQRRHVAQQLRARRKELAADIELHRAQASASASGQELPLQIRLSELQGKYDRIREELDQRQMERDEAAGRLAELKAELELRQRETLRLEAAQQQTQQRQEEWEAERQKFHGLQQQLDEARRHANAAESAKAELEKLRRDSQQQIDQLRTHQDKSSAEQVTALRVQLEQLHASESQAEQTRERLEAELSVLKKAAGSSTGAVAELAKLRDEHKQLEAWLEEAEQKARQAGSSGGPDIDDLRRRFEMAVQDVRELKTKNSELSEQLEKAKQSRGGVAVTGGDGQDWESLKQRMLAQMENDFDDEDAGQKADKLTVQGAIKITDQVVADKEHELAELRQMLDSQSQQVGDVAVGAAAVAQLLDTDELVCQERETLKRLQESLRDQLRKAEVDISLERAKVARERAELEERMRGFDADRASQPGAAETGGDKNKKPTGRKWLTRLGLGENKPE